MHETDIQIHGRKVYVRPLTFGQLRKFQTTEGDERLDVIADVAIKYTSHADGTPFFSDPAQVDDLTFPELNSVVDAVLEVSGLNPEKKG